MGAALPRLVRSRAGITIAVTAVALLILIALSVTTLAYGSTVRDGQQLLPGTTIATVAVGEIAPAEAADLVAAHLDERLDRTITVTDGDDSWTTSPRELGATTDLDEVVDEAVARAGDLGFVDLVKLRWFGGSGELTPDVTVTVPNAEVAAFVAAIAADVDQDPSDAEVAWIDDAVVVTVDSVTGREVDRDAARDGLATLAAGDDGDELELPVAVTEPEVGTDRASEVAAEVTAVVDARLDHVVTVVLASRDETTSARQLGGVPDVGPLIAAAFAGDDVDGDALEVAIPDGAVSGVLDEVTRGTTVAARDASLDVSGGDFRIIPEVVGAAVDRGEATGRLRSALAGATDRVELELRTVRPTVTAASFQDVLVVSRSATTLTLLRDGEAVKSWPVAVGTNNSPTPLGTFVVGAKRYEPTWVNPARDRWGKDMPARIGPGPDNPLGARAVNWNRPGGGDTLIRFHGTPNEDSIGTAASNGCVRMFNADVIELYDLVSTGMVIISTS